MIFRALRYVDKNASLGTLLFAGLVLPGGSVLIAWAMCRWIAGMRGRSNTTPSR